MTAVLEARGLSVGYGGASVVRDLDFDVQPGEVVALLGPNGAGKTTTLLTLAGELRPLQGEVRFLGEHAAGPLHRRARRGLALVTEERSVFMGLTAKQNIALGRCRVERATRPFPELESLLSRRAGLLSGGEQQMLSLGRALAREDVRLLLADELSLGLAPQAVRRLLGAVRQAADDGMAALLVEQHVPRALDVADRVHVISGGTVGFSGSAGEARERMDEIQAHYLSGVGREPERDPAR